MKEIDHSEDVIFVQGKNVAFGRMEAYDESPDGQFQMKTTITEGVLIAGCEQEMMVLIPYNMEQHCVATIDSRN